MSNRDRKRDLQRKQQDIEYFLEATQSGSSSISYPELIQCGIDDWNARKRDDQDPVTEETDIPTLQRLAVNYARHHIFDGYDASYRIPPKNLTHNGRKGIVVENVFEQIALMWPELQNECLRQKNERR